MAKASMLTVEFLPTVQSLIHIITYLFGLISLLAALHMW